MEYPENKQKSFTIKLTHREGMLIREYIEQKHTEFTSDLDEGKLDDIGERVSREALLVELDEILMKIYFDGISEMEDNQKAKQGELFVDPDS